MVLGVVRRGVRHGALIIVGIGELLRLNRARQLEARRARAEERRREAGEERLRIARELHDVVAHHMSLIHVQAGVALHVLDRKPDQVETALTTIKDASKEALTELRALIGVLRAEGEAGAALARWRRLPALQELAARTSQAGVSTTVDVHGDLGGVPRRQSARLLPHRTGGGHERRPAQRRDAGQNRGHSRRCCRHVDR